MRAEILVVALALAGSTACSVNQGTSGDVHQSGNSGGSQGPMGPQGPAGPAGGFVWKDATGVAVDGIVESGSSTLFVDATGRVWTIDPETLALSPVIASLPVHWSNADCTGVPYVATPPLPRMTFQVAGDPSIRVRPDSAIAFSTSVGSVSPDGASCQPLGNGASLPAIALPAPDASGAPELTFLGPLHPERPN